MVRDASRDRSGCSSRALLVGPRCWLSLATVCCRGRLSQQGICHRVKLLIDKARHLDTRRIDYGMLQECLQFASSLVTDEREKKNYR
jgi:hypothetical protein